jgi:ABC-2 type transport system permease protein
MRNLLLVPFHFLVHTFAFLRKEIFEVLRQPRLVLTLVVGPFLILLLFGIGYRNQARPLRFLFVVPPNSEMAAQITRYAQSLGPTLIFEGVTGDERAAMDRLRRGEVDVVAVAPTDAYNTIRQNQQAKFVLYHNEIDPLQVSYIQYFGQIYVDEVNRIVLQQVAQQGQAESGSLREYIQAMRGSSNATRQALQQSDTTTARAQQKELDRNLKLVELAVAGSLGVLNSVQSSMGQDNPDQSAMQKVLGDLRNEVNGLNNIQDNQPNHNAEIQRLDRVDADLTQLDQQLAAFQSIDPYVLVRPFGAEAQGISTIQPQLVDYFAPAVIVLLLQHLAVTFAALSIVRDRQLGTIELFRVSPLSAFETMLGKYLSYLLFGGVIAAILTLLIIYVLRTPMLGDWQDYALVILALLFTSIGAGFLISLLSLTDSQAVQYSMIMLLATMFFSGIFVSLTLFWDPVRLVSWILPATYAVGLLQNIMLRGNILNTLLLPALALFGLGLFIVNWLLLHRSMARQ